MKRLKLFNELFDYNDVRKRKHIKNYDMIDQDNMIITVEEVLEIHDNFIDKDGGIYGIRDEDQLESAVLKPYTSAFGEDVYLTDINKVAALMYAISKLHPFADGNKRTAWGSTKKALSNIGYELNVDYDESKSIIDKIINDDIDNDKISEWLEKNSTKK